MSEHRGLIARAIHRPIGTLSLTAVVVVLGLYFLARLSIDLLPQINYPMVRVGVNYPGASPEVVEEQVTRILETSLASTENMVSMESRTAEGRSFVDLIFEYGSNIDVALQDAARNMELARTQLPIGIQPPRIFKQDPSGDPVVQAGVTSTTRSEFEVRDWLETRLLPQLLAVEGVGGVEVAGGQIREMQVILDQERLNYYGLTFENVLTAIANENIDIAAGQVTSLTFDVQAKTDGRYRSIQELQRIMLTIPGTQEQIPLENIATVRDGHQEQRVFVRLDGQSAIQLSILKLPDANTIQVVDGVRDRISRLAESGFIPPDMDIRITRDNSFFIRSSIASVGSAALLGGGLAMLVVLLFLGSLRKSFIIGLSIPIAIMATFSLMGMGNLTLNIMSLGGLALGVGMLLDNAIVMLENIFRHKDGLGKSSDKAALEGAQEVTSAIVASTLTNLAAVLPFLLIVGLVSMIFRELILTISFAILASLAAALTLVPMMAALLAKVRFSSGLNRSFVCTGFNRGLSAVVAAYRVLASRVIRWRYLVVIIAFSALGGVYHLGKDLGAEFLPQVDDGKFRVRMFFPPGAPPETTNAASRLLEGVVMDMPYVDTIFATVGGHLQGGILNERPGMVTFDVQLSPAIQRPDYPPSIWVREMRQRIEQMDIPGARFYIQSPQIQGIRTNQSGADISVGVIGDEVDVLDQIGRDLIFQLEDIPGLDNPEIERDSRTPLLNVEVDRERAASLGLMTAQVGNAVRNAVLGAVPSRFSTATTEYDIRVMLPRDSVSNRDELGDIVLFRPEGQAIRINDVASFELVEGPAQIARENQVRIVRINADLNPLYGDIGTVNARIREQLRDYPMPDGYNLVYGGEEEVIRETNRNLVGVIALAIFMVFVVLAVQYERIANPLVILSSVPLALIGVGLMLWWTATPLSAPVMLGIILLVGIVVNNAILLVEYIELARKQGVPVHEAVVQAGEVRLRPILMTSLTTILGMTPLAMGLGEGAELMRPLAIAVVGGLMVSMILTLFVVPCLYMIVDSAAVRLRHFLTGRSAAGSAEQVPTGRPEFTRG